MGKSVQVTAVMSRWVLCVMYAVCIAASAEESSVQFDYRRAPAWPYSLSRSGISGWVVYGLKAHHDGRVSEPEVLDSSHPLFALSVVNVVPTWRVKPWVVSEQRPAVISLRQEHYFVHPREGNAPVPWLHRSLRHLSCAKFNKRFEDFQQNASDLEQVEMSVFRHTYSVLARVATYRKLSDEQRFALGDALADAVPEVIQRCGANPELRYKDVLPDEVRRML
ncbi:energy transducer TonB [Pseudomonas graminis]|uniref:energy transducer TonB n=1 Tax=Pseudomonas graminis TaxID=158627 RepID=UPI00234B07DD|nr:energy transducer TonB [Pseudomonas graminis]MDC6379127.1 energy transducer TonB [Pseudomonas graminis]